MNKNFIALIGILGALLFVGVALVGGLLMDEYNASSQFISETYAKDTAYGSYLRGLGVIPSGVLFAIFYVSCAVIFKDYKKIKFGFIGLTLFYGVATILVGLFPCDAGCNKELINPSLSQIIHNLMGMLTYIFVPISILLIGNGLKKVTGLQRHALSANVYGLLSIVLIFVLFANPDSNYIGILQRIIEAIFILWLFTCINMLYNISFKVNNI